MLVRILVSRFRIQRTHQGGGAPKPLNKQILDGEENSRNSSSGKVTNRHTLGLLQPFSKRYIGWAG